MKINFPRGIVVDTDNIPAHFDSMIREAFKDYTNGTNPTYMYQDKLSFIDRCVELLHDCEDEYEEVKNLIKDQVAWELDEYGKLPDKDEFWNLDFMCQCYTQGVHNANLYDHYTGDHRKDDKIMELLYRAIKAVMDYEGENK